MPMYPTPAATEAIATIPVRPDGWAEEGDYAEHFDILAFTREEYIEEARKAARRTVVNGRTSVESADQVVFDMYLIDRCLKGWRVMMPPGTKFNKDTMVREHGVIWWKYCTENIARIPWDIRGWLAAQIVNRGGSVDTRDLITEGPTGKPLSFRWQDAGLVSADESGEPDTERDAVLPTPKARA